MCKTAAVFALISQGYANDSERAMTSTGTARNGDSFIHGDKARESYRGGLVAQQPAPELPMHGLAASFSSEAVRLSPERAMQ